eukprot:CAMPEP_0115082244 /NCGR_PEP_ID=MMETSP0227-20121206/19783_1 /TAXON_ID=89957 /ORGANISM="Polarella glacialis, Strain CCMP 1383" /LENGTH=38 /DNA_ID= /DNA_START= /DNA_END= /DNA_ORIENTATION=
MQALLATWCLGFEGSVVVEAAVVTELAAAVVPEVEADA